MKIASVELRDFKRFAHLTISGLPASARLVVLAGPNGFGKSSLFDAFQLWGGRANEYKDYYDRTGSDLDAPVLDQRQRKILFHGQQITSDAALPRKTLYVRSAYRNEPELAFGGVTKLGSVLDEQRPQRMIHAHPTTSQNYLRLVSDAFDDAFERRDGTTPLESWRDGVIAELRAAMERLFPGLSLNGLAARCGTRR